MSKKVAFSLPSDLPRSRRLSLLLHQQENICVGRVGGMVARGRVGLCCVRVGEAPPSSLCALCAPCRCCQCHIEGWCAAAACTK